MDIEKGDIVIQDMQGFAVVDRDQMNAVTDETVEFVLQGQLTEGVNGGYQAIVAVSVSASWQ